MSCQIAYPVVRVGPLVCTFGNLPKWPMPCLELDLFSCIFGNLAKLPIPCLELDLLCSHSEVLPNCLSRVETWTSCVHIRKSSQMAYTVFRVGPFFVHIRKSCQIAYPMFRVGPLVFTFGSLAKLPIPCGAMDILCAHSDVLPNCLSRVENWTSCAHIRKSGQIAYPVLRVGPLVCAFGCLAKLSIPC
ncbi:hypothetical protein PoB_004619200 [Plakobranchus ocellatus]|uniref:Uncharacterized protein n=1 Tax=Plakobranchus ocellatus TaxID=259542 RepID=A0AAV4BK35_9GAST|nr:hypothetical protein PoB_004619200 [Plakobranchus ocellatus]